MTAAQRCERDRYDRHRRKFKEDPLALGGVADISETMLTLIEQAIKTGVPTTLNIPPGTVALRSLQIPPVLDSRPLRA